MMAPDPPKETDGVALPDETPDKEEKPAAAGDANAALTFSEKWTRTINKVIKPVLKVLLKVTHHAATHPKTYVVSIIVISMALMVIGVATNFELQADEDVWTPQNALSVKHGDWVDSDDSGFPKDPRYAMLVVHRDGKNILGDDPDDNELAIEGVRRVFEALDAVRDTPGYHELCAKRDYVHPVTKETTCDIVGVSTHWNDNIALFEELQTDQDVVEALSAKTYPSGRGVDFDQVVGFNKCDNDDTIDCRLEGILTSGLSYVTVVGLPGQDETEDEAMDVESDFIDALKDMKEDWAAEKGNDFRLELLAYRSFEDEFMRAMIGDFPLLPLVFVVMSFLCVCIYARRDPVFSRSWLGFGAVVTVMLAIVASFGFLFLCGVPMTGQYSDRMILVGLSQHFLMPFVSLLNIPTAQS